MIKKPVYIFGSAQLLENCAPFLLLSLCPLVIWNVDYHAKDGDFSFCLFKMITGHRCYGCGLLRGMSALLHGDYRKAVRLNHLNALTIPLLITLYLFKWKDACRERNPVFIKY